MVRRTWYRYDVSVLPLRVVFPWAQSQATPHTPPIIYEGLSQSIRWNLSLLHRPLKEGLLSTACACAKLLDFFPVNIPIILDTSEKIS